MKTTSDPVKKFLWPPGSDREGDVDLYAHLDTYDINEINWDLGVWWNMHMAEASRRSWEDECHTIDYLPEAWQTHLRTLTADEIDLYLSDMSARIPKSEKFVVDYMEFVIGHLVRSVDDVAGKPFMLYDPQTGVWRREGQWVSTGKRGTSVSSKISDIIGQYAAALNRAVDSMEDLITEVVPPPVGARPQGGGAAQWDAQLARHKRMMETVKKSKQLVSNIMDGKYRTIESELRKRLAVSQTEWDKDTKYLVLRDGVIDLEDVFRYKRCNDVMMFSPFHFSTMALDVAWTDARRNAGKSEWEKGVAKLVSDPELRTYLQKRYGAALLGKPGLAGKSLVWQYGVADTGKSTIQEAIAGAKGVFAPYAYQADSEVLTTKGADRGATDRFIAYVRGKRFAIISELDAGARLNQGKFKSMTGGETVQGTAKYSNEVTYFFTPTLFVSSNHPPSLDYGDTALNGRIHVVPFTNRLTVRSKVSQAEWDATPVDKRADEQWLDRLLDSPQERAGILHWVIDGLIMFGREGMGDLPQAMQAAGKEFIEEGDPVSKLVYSLLGRSDDNTRPQLVEIYRDREWEQNGWLERDGLPLAVLEELIVHRAKELGMANDFGDVPRKQVNAAKKMLHELGGAKKKVCIGVNDEGKSLTVYAYSRIRQVAYPQPTGQRF